MAEGGKNTVSGGGDSWENWLGGWMQTAKEKSQSALEFVKKDLTEFGTTLQKETEKAVEVTKGSLHSESTTEATKKVKAGLVSFLDNVSKVLVIPHDDDRDDIPMKVAADGSGLYDRGKARLHAIQLDASTYIDPPHGSPEQYSMWLDSFSLDEHKGEISELLVSQVEVRALYTKLVPSEVSNADFWQRYFYRVHQLQCDEARKQALMMRADQAGGRDSFTWDDDEDDEEDDGNHSDWEKMPRPPQSYAAQKDKEKKQLPKSPLASKTPDSTSQTTETQKQKALETDTNETSLAIQQSTSNNEDSEKQSLPASQVCEEAPNEQQKSAGVSDTGRSASEPTHLSLSQLDDSSAVSGDASSGESPAWSPLADAPTAANPWSLHIVSEDLACASEVVDDSPEDSTTLCQPQEGATMSADTQEKQFAEANHARKETDAGVGASSNVEPASASETVVSADGAVGASTESFSQSEEVCTSSQTPSVQCSQSLDSLRQTVDVVEVEPAPDSSATMSSNDEEQGTESVAPSVPESQAANTVSGVQIDTKDKFVPVKDTDSSHEPTVSPTNVAEEGSSEKEKGVSGDKDGDSAEKDIAMKVKGDMVVIGDRDSPSSTEDSTDISKGQRKLGLDEDWEQDFDVEITEEDLKAAEDIAKRLGERLDDNDDDWENWE